MGRARFERRNGRVPWDESVRSHSLNCDKLLKKAIKDYSPIIEGLFLSYRPSITKFFSQEATPKSKEESIYDILLWARKQKP